MENLAPLHLIHSEGLQERAYSLQHHQNPRLCTKCHILLVRRDFEFNFSPFVCVGSKGAVEVFKNSSQNYFVQADVTYCRYGQSVVIVVRYLIRGRETMADSAARHCCDRRRRRRHFPHSSAVRSLSPILAVFLFMASTMGDPLAWHQA